MSLSKSIYKVQQIKNLNLRCWGSGYRPALLPYRYEYHQAFV